MNITKPNHRRLVKNFTNQKRERFIRAQQKKQQEVQSPTFLDKNLIVHHLVDASTFENSYEERLDGLDLAILSDADYEPQTQSVSYVYSPSDLKKFMLAHIERELENTLNAVQDFENDESLFDFWGCALLPEYCDYLCIELADFLTELSTTLQQKIKPVISVHDHYEGTNVQHRKEIRILNKWAQHERKLL